MILAHLVCLLLAMPMAAAQQENDERFAVTAVDLHSAFAEVDFALTEQPNIDVGLVNRTLDRGLRRFLAGNRIGAVREVRLLGMQIRHGGPLPPEAGVLASLKVQVTPPVAVAGSDTQVVAHVGSMFAAAPVEGAITDYAMLLRVIGPDGAVVSQQAFSAAPIDNNLVREDLTLRFIDDQPKPGRYVVEVETSNGLTMPMATWYVVDEALDDARQGLINRLDAIDANRSSRSGVRYQTLLAVRSRANRLADATVNSVSIHSRFDPQQLLSDVRSEVEVLEKAGDPLAGRTGHQWRTVRIGDVDVPMRLYVPSSTAGNATMPLVIAIQGITGDESLFPDIYGEGVLADLADEHGFILAAPDSQMLTADPTSFDFLISEVAANYQVDLKRVYLIGHSSGTQPVDVFCMARTNRIAAACMIASDGLLSPEETFPPLLLVHGWMDTITEADRVEKLTRVANVRGIPATFLGVEQYGHVLVVGHALPQIVEWLLQFAK